MAEQSWKWKSQAKALRKLEMAPHCLIRFVNKIAASKRKGDCWPWVGSCDGKRYGKFWLNRRMYMAHRIAYFLWVGPIERGMEIDHLCRNRACCNPEHLEKVTSKENKDRRYRDTEMEDAPF